MTDKHDTENLIDVLQEEINRTDFWGGCCKLENDTVRLVLVELNNFQAKCDALAAENGKMLDLLTDVSDNHTDFFNESEDGMYACLPLDYVSEINMYVSRDVNAENPFAATDAALAEIKAQGVDELATNLWDRSNELVSEFAKKSIVIQTRVAAKLAEEFAANLRAGRKG